MKEKKEEERRDERCRGKRCLGLVDWVPALNLLVRGYLVVIMV